MKNYILTKNLMYNEEIGEYVAYGIEFTGDPNIGIKDISTKRTYVNNIVELLNNFEVSPIHLYDVIEDLMD